MTRSCVVTWPVLGFFASAKAKQVVFHSGTDSFVAVTSLRPLKREARFKPNLQLAFHFSGLGMEFICLNPRVFGHLMQIFNTHSEISI